MSFRHVDHVELAWRLCGELPFAAAYAQVEARLIEVATAAGVPEKYNREMTRNYLELIAARRREAPPDQTWAEFVVANRELFDDGAALLARLKPVPRVPALSRR